MLANIDWNQVAEVLKSIYNTVMALFMSPIPDDAIAYVDALMEDTLLFIRQVFETIGPLG